MACGARFSRCATITTHVERRNQRRVEAQRLPIRIRWRRVADG
jgi:hypothetical protein